MSNQPAEPMPYLTFVLADNVFAVNIEGVREIIPCGSMTRVPMMPRFIRGILNLRGAVVPVVDLRCRFGWDSAEVTPYTCIVIIDAAHADSATQLGLMVDSVCEVIDIAPEAIEPPPGFGTPISQALIEGMARHNDGFLVILKPSQAFDLGVLTQMVVEHATV